MAKTVLTDEQRKAKQMEAAQKAAATKANNKAQAQKMNEEMAAKKNGVQPTIPAATVLTDEAATKAEKVRIHLRTHFYNTAGTKMEIGPNLMDIQYNQDEKAPAIWEMIKEAGLHTTNKKTGRDTTINYSEAAGEAHKGRGTIQVIRYRPRGHDEDNYISFLKANEDITIKVLTAVNYPFSKQAAREAGRDNREYTFQDISEITITAGTAIPLAITTNYNKTLAYSNKYSQLYKVHFPTSQYSGIDLPLHKSNGELMEFNGELEIMRRRLSEGPTGETTTFSFLLETENIFDISDILTGKQTAI